MVDVALQPAIVSGPADATAQPINLIRATVLRADDGSQLAEVDFPVSPDDAEWEISVPVPVGASEVEVSVRLGLLNVDAGGAESLEFSGTTPPIPVAAGVIARPTDVTLVRGPLANLAVTDIAISAAPTDLLAGESSTLSANVTWDDAVEGTPEVFWVSSDPTVASVAGDTVIGEGEGAVEIVAVSGMHSDTTVVEVLPAFSSISVSPPETSVVGFGATESFSAVVLDGRGNEVVDPDLTWSTSTPSIITSLGSGIFEAVGLGQGVVEATVSADPTVTGSATMFVDPVFGDLVVRKTVTNSQPTPGDTVSFEVSLANSANFPATNVVVLDTVPAGVTFLSATATVGSYDAATHAWTLGEIAAGGVETLTLDVEVVSANDTITNRARVVPPADYEDQDASNDVALARIFSGAAPALPPSGVIAFVSERNGGRDLWRKDLETGVVELIVDDGFFSSGPAFSPDGSLIAFSDNAQELFVMSSVDGSGLTSLTGPSGSANAGSASWSPDGSFVAYQGVDTDWEIVVVEVADTANRVFLTNNAVADQFPDWSPDGSRIAFSVDQNSIVTVRASDGGDPRTVYQGFNRYPDWSPDGTEIVFYAGGPVLAVDVTTGAVRTVLSDGADNWYPKWSPDGEWIVVSKVPDFPGDFQLWAVRSDGSGEQVQVEMSNSTDFYGTWTSAIPPG